MPRIIPTVVTLLALTTSGHADTLEERYQEGVRSISELAVGSEAFQGADNPFPKSGQFDALVRDIENLRSQVVMSRRMALATEKTESVKAVGAKTVFNFQEGKLYEIHAAVDRISVLELESGEELSSEPVSGDTVRWKVAVSQGGEGKEAKTFLIVKPLEPDIETNFLVTTNRRVYYLKAISSGPSYMPAISWNYPSRASGGSWKKKPVEERLSFEMDKLNFGYEVRGKGERWAPVRVFDDGEKTFLQMPKEVKAKDLPAFFVLDGKGETVLTNYRIVGDYFVIDRLFERAELRVSEAERVEIRSDEFEESFWEWLF